MSGPLADAPRFPDPRFYETTGSVALGELAALAGATLADPALSDRSVVTVASLAMADADAVSFCAGREHAQDLATTRAGAVFAPPALDHGGREVDPDGVGPARRRQLGQGAPVAAAVVEDARVSR